MNQPPRAKEVPNTEVTDEDRRNFREAQLRAMRRGNRKERRQASKRLRRDMKRSGLSRDYAVSLSKRMVKKYG